MHVADQVNTGAVARPQGANSIDRLNWLVAVCKDANLPPNASRVATMIASYLNSRTGKAWPSQATLADQLGMSKDTVRRCVAALVEAGHLDAETGDGRGHATVYRLAEKGGVAATLSKKKKGSTAARKRVAPLRHKGLHGCNPNLLKEPEDKNRGNIPLTPLVRETAQEGDLFKDHPEPKFPVTAISLPGLINDSNRGDREPGPANSDADDKAFEQFWLAYPRREAKGAARKAWRAVLKTGASPAVIIDGARRYGARRAAVPDPAERHRFTAMPATWLRAERWADEAQEPPAGCVTIDGATGEPIPDQGRSHPAKLTGFDPFAFGARYAESMEG